MPNIVRLSTIFYLYRVRLRARLGQELLAVAGIAIGVALLFASQVANTSLSGSVTRLTNELVGNARLQLVARDPYGFSEQLIGQVERLPGVAVAAPFLERNINVVGPTGAESVDLIGVDRRFIQLNGPLLAHVNSAQLYRQNGVALPAHVAEDIGVKSLQSLTVQIGAKNVQAILALELNATDIGLGVNSPVAIMPLLAAQKVTGMLGSVSRILVEPEAGQDRQVRIGLQKIAGGRLNVWPANFDATVFRQAEGPTVQSTELFSAISALVGFVFAFNAMLLTVPQRRNLITDLRLDGYTPLEILEVMLFDVLALGIVGVLAGLGLGDFLSGSLLQSQPGYLSLAFPVGSLHVVSWESIVIAGAGGLLAAVVGVIVPLRGEIFGYQPVGATRSSKRPARFGAAALVIGGVVCIALTSMIMLRGISTVDDAVLAFVSLTLALLLILPVAFSGVIAVIDRVQWPIMGVSSRIALIELLSSTTKARSLSIAATGAIAVFGSVAIEGAHGNLRDGLARSAADLSFGTDLWVSPSGGATTLPTTPFHDIYTRKLERLSDVASVRAYRGGFLDIGDRRVLVLAPPKSDSRLVSTTQIVDGDLASATVRMRQDGWLTVSRELAKELHLSIGRSFVLPSPRPTVFRVAAITTNFGWSPGAIVMNADDYAQAWKSQNISAYQVILKSGVRIQAGLLQVRSAIDLDTALVVQSADRHDQNEVAGQKQGLVRLTDIAALVLVAAALAMAAAMGAMLWQRRPRLAGMKVDGFGQGELWGALLWECALLLGTGCSIGAVFGLYGQLVLSHALVSVTGFPIVFSVGFWVAVVSLLAVTAIALVVVALPGYLAVQVKPALQE